MVLKYPQDGGSVCCCYDCHVDARLQNNMVHYVLNVTGCIMSDACHTERECPQDGGCGKRADGLYTTQHDLSGELNYFALIISFKYKNLPFFRS